MKVLSPTVTCLLASHMKALYLGTAIASAVGQTRRDLQVLVIDSGQWISQDDDRSAAMAALHYRWASHPLVEWVTTGEGPELRREKCPIGWVTNEAIRGGLVRGRYVCTFYDDDRYRPRYMEAMAGILDRRHAWEAVYCSQELFKVALDGSEMSVGHRHATSPRGPGQFDCQIDGAQIMFRREILDQIGDPWLPEAPNDDCRHSDGLFMEKVAAVAGKVHPVPEVLVDHRFTPLSAYTPSPV